MSGCRVEGCREDTRGQMLGCGPHWSLLSDTLRLELVASWDSMEDAKAFNRPVVAALERWYALVARAENEWAVIRAEIRPELAKLPRYKRQNGRTWARIMRQRAGEAPAEGDLDAQGNLMGDGELWKERTGGD